MPAEEILSLVEQYGWAVVFLSTLIQSAGVPLPAQTVLMVSGFLVQQGHIELWQIIMSGILGTLLGGPIGYWVSHELGRPFVLRWGRYALITPSRLQRTEKFFERHGGGTILLVRFIPGVKSYGALLAGINRMNWKVFLFYNAVGGGAWTTTMVFVGYLLGEQT